MRALAAGRAWSLALGALMLMAAFTPLATALDVSTKAVRVVGSANYNPNTVDAYATEFGNWQDGYSVGFQGKRVGVAVVDTGVDDDHPSLKGSFVAGARYEPTCDGGEGCMQASQQTTDGEQPLNPDDSNGHGTHVASTAIGSSDGPAHRGVAPRADLVDVKIASDVGGISSGGISTALDWIIDYNEGDTDYDKPTRKVHVVSLSFGGLEPHQDQEYDDAMSAVKRATNAGITVVVSAGNCGPGDGGIDQCSRDKNGITSPGTTPEAITVAAVDDNENVNRGEDSVADYSSRGPNPADDASGEKWRKPDIVAPGTDIEAARNEQLGQEEWQTEERSGTSMAAPHVAGLAAILYQGLRDFSDFEQPDDGSTPEKIKSILTSTATDLAEDGWDAKTGYGYIDGYGAIVKATNTRPTPVFDHSPTNATTDDQIRFDGTDSQDPDEGDTVDRYIWHVDGERFERTGDATLEHLFDEPGEHEVTLAVEDTRGVLSAEPVEATVEVNPEPEEDPNQEPTAAFTHSPTQPRVGTTVEFDASDSSDLENNISLYAWDLTGSGSFNPQETTDEPENTWTFDEPGNHTVAVRVQDGQGATSTARVTVDVRKQPDPPPAVNLTNPQDGDVVDAGAIVTAWSLSEGAADEFHVYLDGIKEDVVEGRQLEIDVTPGNHTLRVNATGPAGNDTDRVNFTAVDDEALGASNSDGTRTDGSSSRQAPADENGTDDASDPSGSTPAAPKRDTFEDSSGSNDTPAPSALVLAGLLATVAAARRP
jgi:subtilisin family serine protease